MKKLLLIAGILCAVGLFVGFLGLVLMDFDFTKLSRVQYEEHVYEITEAFDRIEISAETVDVRIALAEDGVCRVECMESEKLGYTVEVKDGTLTVSLRDTRKWYDHIGLFHFSQPMTVYLPETAYDRLSVSVTTGDVEVADGFSFDRMDVKTTTGDVKIGSVSVSGAMRVDVTTGDITLDGVRAGTLTVEATTGDILLADVRTEETLAIENTTGDINLTDVLSNSLTVECTSGDVSLKHCNAFYVEIKTTTGDIEGTLLQEKWFVVKTTTGDVNLPSNTAGLQGGYCYLTTTTGDIDIRVP